MEKPNPFAAALKVLKSDFEAWEWTQEEYRSLDAAIRVLEAAGKVDKALALGSLKTIVQVYGPTIGGILATTITNTIPLLESLPDKEPK